MKPLLLSLLKSIFVIKKEPALLMVQKCALFKGVSTRQTNYMQCLMHVRNYGAGEIVFKQGGLGECLFIILSGSIHLHIDYDSDAPSEESKVLDLGPSEYFGEVGFISDNAKREFTASSCKPSTLAAFSRQSFEQLKTHPETKSKFLNNLAKGLGDRVSHAMAKTHELKGLLETE